MCLCRLHHDNVQAHLTDKDIQWEWIAKTLGRAIDLGVIVVEPKKHGD
jgi:hypothetical protein